MASNYANDDGRRFQVVERLIYSSTGETVTVRSIRHRKDLKTGALYASMVVQRVSSSYESQHTLFPTTIEARLR